MMCKQYRKGLRIFSGCPVTLRSEVLYVVLLRWPLEVALAKAVWRYFHRVQEDLRGE